MNEPCKHFWESWLDAEQWQCCYCGKREAIVDPDAIATIEAERDAAMSVLQQIVAAQDAMDDALAKGREHRGPWPADLADEYERAELRFAAFLENARRLVVHSLAAQP